jgi:putative SOS response-associated peptidase YedK
MCGRYMLYYEKDLLIDAFNLVNEFEYEERFNIAPSQNVLAIIKGSNGNRAGYMRWGFVPGWADGDKFGSKLINARSETVNEKASFRESFIKQRCLIPANGFYEWKDEDGKRQPYHFFLKDNKTFAFAGIWSRWTRYSEGKKEEKVTCAILTKESNMAMENYHQRMPVLLLPEEGGLWLEKEAAKKELMQLISDSNPPLEASPVSMEVNKPEFDNPSCIMPLSK